MQELETLPISLPEYSGSHPFSKGKPIFYRTGDLRDKAQGDTDRTYFFEKHLVAIFLATGRRPVPYAFKIANGETRSMDAGCLKFLANRKEPVIEFRLDSDGIIVAVAPLPALLSRFSIMQDRLVREVIAPSIVPCELPFSIDEPVDERRKIESERVVRDGAALFREGVLKAWSGKCAVTGVSVPSVIEAAHIYPYGGPATNHIRNGIALRSDIHKLFDEDLLSFTWRDEKLTVCISNSLASSAYASFAGKLVDLPEAIEERPAAELIRYLEARFKAAEAERDG